MSHHCIRALQYTHHNATLANLLIRDSTTHELAPIFHRLQRMATTMQGTIFFEKKKLQTLKIIASINQNSDKNTNNSSFLYYTVDEKDFP